MGSATDGPDIFQFAQALGYPMGSYAIPGAGGYGGDFSGSVTDGPRIMIGAAQAAAPAPAPLPAKVGGDAAGSRTSAARGSASA